VKDAERLSHDPAFRLIGSEKIWERGAALTSRVHSFETGSQARGRAGRSDGRSSGTKMEIPVKKQGGATCL
jgi:hypothetical protein